MTSDLTSGARSSALDIVGCDLTERNPVGVTEADGAA